MIIAVLTPMLAFTATLVAFVLQDNHRTTAWRKRLADDC
jgi:hypothetical protein